MERKDTDLPPHRVEARRCESDALESHSEPHLLKESYVFESQRTLYMKLKKEETRTHAYSICEYNYENYLQNVPFFKESHKETSLAVDKVMIGALEPNRSCADSFRLFMNIFLTSLSLLHASNSLEGY